MLSKIASVIINYNEVDSVIKREKALEIAETILQVQEEAGMLPPFDDWTYQMDGDRANPEGTFYFKWEPEDEEK